MSKISDAEIAKRKCDLNKPFIFFSYSHKDIEFVRSVFVELYDKGHNIWLDGAMLLHDGTSWDQTAVSAILNPNCKMFMFFRSETSMVSVPCSNEVINARDEKQRAYGVIQSPCIDVWSMKGQNAEKVLAAQTEEKDKATCEVICKYISTSANAIRYSEDCQDNLDKLIEKLQLVIEEEPALKDAPIIPERKLETKLDWNQSTWKFVDYWRGAADVQRYDVDAEEEVFAGYTPIIAIKKYETIQGSCSVLFFHYAKDEEGYEETCACIVDSDVSTEEFVQRLDTAIYEKTKKCADLEHDPYFYVDKILSDEECVPEDLEYCSEDLSDYESHRYEFRVYNPKGLFDKYFVDQEIQKDIENTLKILAHYNIACDADGFYMSWTY